MAHSLKLKKLLHDKASKAMYSLIQKGRRLKLPTDIMLKLFNSCVAPILLYGCEVWGYDNTDIIEKKYIQSSVNSSLVYQHFPIIFQSNQHKLNKVMYDILYNLHCKDIHSSGWIKCINTIFFLQIMA